VRHILLDNNVTQAEVQYVIDELNSNDDVNGIILQLPIPEHLNQRELLDSICPYKDVDGLGAYQLGWLGTKDKRALAPCTAKGVIVLLDNVVEEGLVGKDICVVNCSYLIGIPLQTMLRDIATVTVCHKLTNDLKNKMRNADIVITGIGCAKFFDRSYVSNGQVIIDCSMNFDNGKLCGDYDLESLKSMDVLIASGAGHTGPMTVLSLMINTVQAYINQNII
jgi:methylenetetrahydrofolate dehydrogenase (NADP+)/methenyltetrahydrofolate cyclohydrolase